jgi:hypothetical protein
MAFKIFYAWQSDTSTRLNRHFIHDAIQDAITILNTEIDIEDAPAFEIDHDTKGVPGHPSVAETICEKIDECAIFLSDVSFVTKYTKADGTTTKWTPNPNVMVELGYARRAKGPKLTIEVMNTGVPSGGKPTDLPFDLAHLRHPIQYKLTDAKDEAKVGKVREDLAKDIVLAIKTALETVIAAEQKKSEAARVKAIADAQERVAVIRNKFDQQIRDDDFHGLTAQGVQPILAFSIIPDTPANPPLDVIKQKQDILQRLTPMLGTSAWDYDFSPGSLRSFALAPVTTGEKIRDTVTEFRNDGSLFAAAALEFQDSPDPKRPAQIAFAHYEYELFRTVERYLRLFRTDLNFSQDLVFCLSLHRCRNFVLVPEHRHLRTGLRRIDALEIISPPVRIPPGPAPTDAKGTSVLLTDALNHVWQVCGLEFDPHIIQPK